MRADRPDWLRIDRLRPLVDAATRARVDAALGAPRPGPEDLAALLSPPAGQRLEELASRARAITRRRFGRTISLYTPLYLSNWCSGGCAYCGFASDVRVARRRLEPREIERELDAIRELGVDEVLLLTGERSSRADLTYVREAVRLAAERFSNVAVEAFPMEAREYGELAAAGCTSVTLYQETYDPDDYLVMHRWGPKRDYLSRLDAPARALSGGIRSVGLGVLLGISEPVGDLLSLYLHLRHLQRLHWDAGVTVSFPRIRPQAGGFEAPWPVGERTLFQAICALRIALPDVPLVLSTREPARFRDGVSGIGISKMSVASRTTVGGYADADEAASDAQFEVDDDRGIDAVCTALRSRGLAPVFKDWDACYRQEGPASQTLTLSRT